MQETSRSLRIQLHQFLLLAALLWPAGAYAQESGHTLLLKNERLLEGTVYRLGDRYQVKMGEGSKVTIPADQVAFVGQSKLEAYQFLKSSVATWTVGEHFQLTRWCLLNGLLDEATAHYQLVAQSHGEHTRVKQLGKELEKKLLEIPGFRAYLGLAPIEKQSPVVTASAVVPASDDGQSVDIISTTMHPEIAALYSRKVQPILMNRCSQAACHGTQTKTGLMIKQPYAREFARISTENLASVLKYVRRESKEISPLLKYATKAHGIQKQAAISVAETQLLKELSEWIQFVQNPVVSAVAVHERAGNQVRTAQARQFVPFSPAVALVPDGPIRVPSRIPSGAMPLGTGGNPAAGGQATQQFPSGQSPSISEIDELDRQLRQILGENPAPSADPFDPEEFNRQSRNLR